MSVWILPIEPFEERYTSQWWTWWPRELAACGLDVRIVQGDRADVDERAGGEFLDPCMTWAWKGVQVAALARLWRSGQIKDGDVVLNLDIWGPGTTAAMYLRHTTGVKVKVVGFYHAGASDPADFLARTGCATWALDVERGWLKGCDAVLCGSEHSRALLHALAPTDNVHVVGLPIHAEGLRAFSKPWHERERVVVFPHRLAPEKEPAQFDALRHAYEMRYPDEPARFVRTRDVCTTKSEYYALLGASRCSFSSAHQETFGIAMQECIALGAWAVAPDRLSYPETLRAGGTTYRNLDEAVEAVHRALSAPAAAAWDGWHEDAIKRAAAVLCSL